MPPTQSEPVPEVDEVVIKNDVTVEVKWHDHTPSRFHTMWLRYHCHCLECKEEFSGMRKIHPDDVPQKLTLKTAKVEDGFLLINCNEENHNIRHPLGWLKAFSYSKEDLQRKSTLRDLEYKTDAVMSFDFKEICQLDDVFFRWLEAMDKFGIALIKNVPCEEGKVCEVGELIAPVYQTLYGKVFNVVAKPRTTNIAYLEVPLEFHQDLPYYESPPGLQFLHCIQLDPSVEGGANVFVDVFHVAEQLQREYPEYFETLLRVPATFQKIHDDELPSLVQSHIEMLVLKTVIKNFSFFTASERPSHFVYQRPHITVNCFGKVTGVFWNAQAEGPLQVSEEMVQPYYKAYFKFAELMEKSPASITYRLEQGECVTFNNRRMVHSRKPFKLNGGVRRLQGIYINVDDFKNAIQIQYLKRKSGQLVKRMGNQCYF